MTTRRMLLVLLTLSLVILAGCKAIDRIDDVLYPTDTPGVVEVAPTKEPEPTPVPDTSPVPPVATSELPQPTLTPEPTFTTEPTLTQSSPTASASESREALVYAQGSSIYRGDYLGANAIEAASIAPLDAWAFHEGVLAIARGQRVELLDLNEGSLRSVQVLEEARVTHSQVLWSTTGRSLLYAAVVQDADEDAGARGLDLRVLANDGKLLSQVTIDDVSGVNLVSWDDTEGSALLIPLAGDASFAQLDAYDMGSGKVVHSYAVQGEGMPIISPDGRYLLTQAGDVQAGAVLHLFDLRLAEQQQPLQLSYPQRSHAVSLFWSPDSRYVAYLLQEGDSYESSVTKGLWVLDVGTMESHQVLEEDSLSSFLVGWSPDSAAILGYHRGSEGDSYYYTVRPDGGGRQILGLSPEATVLGWMPAVAVDVPKVVGDLWQERFVNAAQSERTMANVVAQFVAAQGVVDEDELSRRVGAYLQQADVPIQLVQPRVRRVTETIHLAYLPPFAIHVLEGGQAQAVASGNLLLDARLEQERIGLVFGVLGPSSAQPAYVVLQRSDDGTWLPLWMPQGLRDWITTDGEIRFAGEGLDTIELRGSSFGLDIGQDAIFSECQACVHRWLRSTWVWQTDGYARETDLPEDASLDQVYWEMTERTPYAVLNESLRRMRQELPLEDVVVSSDVIEQVRALGLLEASARFIVEEEGQDTVTFRDLDGSRRFVAVISQERLASVSQL